jgi:hypothetical protein
VTQMIRATDFCGSITREKIVLTTYQRTRYTVHPSIKKGKSHPKLPRAKARVLMASSHVSVEENSSSTILAADIGGTNARFQVLFNLVLWITCSHSYKYNADMEL